MKKDKAYGIILYKVEKKDIKILLCKSVTSKEKWGCLKGVKEIDESDFQCAKREFREESSINIDISLFEDYFEQLNYNKDIGIWLVNVQNLENIDKYFIDDKLLDNFLSWENSKVKFFSLNDLPAIKKKQVVLIEEVKKFLKKKFF